MGVDTLYGHNRLRQCIANLGEMAICRVVGVSGDAGAAHRGQAVEGVIGIDRARARDTRRAGGDRGAVALVVVQVAVPGAVGQGLADQAFAATVVGVGGDEVGFVLVRNQLQRLITLINRDTRRADRAVG